MKPFTIFLILLLVVLLSSCAKLEAAGYEAGKKLGSTIVGEEVEEEELDPYCISQAQELLIDEVQLILLGDQWYLKNYQFKDGLLKKTSIRYTKGKQKGENVNYWYPNNLLDSPYLSYSQQQVAGDGTIYGDFSFKVKFILLQTDQEPFTITNTTYNRDILAQTFIVVEKEFKDCSLP